MSAGVLAIASPMLLAASMSMGCLTNGQVRSVQSQVSEIRRQVDRVATVREQEISALRETPRDRRDVDQTSDRLDSGRSLTEPPAPDRQPGSDESGEAEKLYREGYALYHRGEYAEAETLLRKSLDLRAGGEEGGAARLLLADALAARGLDREAIDALQPLIDMGRPPALAARALFQRALCLQRTGSTGAARRDLKAVLDLFPESDVAPLARARLQAP